MFPKVPGCRASRNGPRPTRHEKECDLGEDDGGASRDCASLQDVLGMRQPLENHRVSLDPVTPCETDSPVLAQ